MSSNLYLPQFMTENYYHEEKQTTVSNIPTFFQTEISPEWWILESWKPVKIALGSLEFAGWFCEDSYHASISHSSPFLCSERAGNIHLLDQNLNGSSHRPLWERNPSNNNLKAEVNWDY